MSGRIIKAADMFCGAGGTSSGAMEACRDLGFGLDLVAINHWPLAIQTHIANHPWARHILASLMPIEPTQGKGHLFETGVDAVDPRKAVPSGKLDILLASPECTNHSNAKGGKPKDDQSRATPWCILRWADACKPDEILIENVAEFRRWGPLDKHGKPIKSEEGKTFAAFLNAIDSLGYRVESKVLCAADFGDPTTRSRLFIRARRGRAAIVWPTPSHSRSGGEGMTRWRPAHEVIDWRMHGQSIFTRRTPLKPKTIERIAHGLRKFGGAAAEPFLVMLYGTGTSRSVDMPMPTVTASGNHIGLVEPFLVQYHGGADSARRTYSVDSPLPTQDCSNRYGLCEPFIIATGHNEDPRRRVRSVNEPLGTIVTKAEHCLVEPFVVKYYGTGKSQSVDQPLDTVTTKPRFGLAEPCMTQDEAGNVYGLDILFRMLQPHELAAAMSFPAGYSFQGTKDEQVKQIGNAVPTQTVRSLVKEMIA